MMMIQETKVRDTSDEKTFAPATEGGITRGPGRLYAAIGAGLIGIGLLVWLFTAVSPQVLVEIGLAISVALLGLFLMRRAVDMTHGKPHAEMLSLLCGVAAGGGIFELFVFAAGLTTDEVHRANIFLVYVGLWFAMLLGATLAFVLGGVIYWPVHVVAGRLLRCNLKTEAVLIGGATGAVVATVSFLSTQPKTLLEIASVASTMLCAYRAALLHERFAATRGRR
ncbi:MAG: hypothetical protein C0483_12525 [Pirellula sp.]|nr:hypothetical protein [Pirellula sp.]